MAGKKKYFDKYDTEEELAEAYQNLEKKLGEHGATIGERNKALEQYQTALGQHQQALAQHQQALAQMKPAYDWMVANQAGLQQYQQWAQSGGAQRLAAQTAQAASQQPGYELLTPEEQQRYISRSVQAVQEQVFRPYTQQLEQGMQQMAARYMNQLRTEMAQQNRASTQVLWDSLLAVTPEEQKAKLNRLHAATIRYSDPNSFDPQEAAREHLGLQAELENLRERASRYEAEAEQRARAEVGSVTGPAPSLFQDDAPAPKDRDERRAQVLGQFRDTVGTDAYRDLMPSSGGR